MIAYFCIPFRQSHPDSCEYRHISEMPEYKNHCYSGNPWEDMLERNYYLPN